MDGKNIFWGYRGQYLVMGRVCGGVVLAECVNRPALPLVMGCDGCVVCVGLGPSTASLGTTKAQDS